MISILAPSRGRPDKCFDNINNWIDKAGAPNIEVIVSLDEDDPELKNYQRLFAGRDYSTFRYYADANRSAVDAINAAAKSAIGQVFIVVSDDTQCFNSWAYLLQEEVKNMYDFILKTQDGIQNYIITMPVMDRAYYNRTGYIYHPDFEHMFCDTYLTCVADITGRKITSNLLFPHLNDSIKDDLRKRTDATWKQGQDTFIRLMKEFSPADRAKITDPAMKNWLRNHGVR